MKLREVAFSRCGDKGNVSNVNLFPYDEADWPWIRDWLTVDVVGEKYGPLVQGEISRYEFPLLHGLNFVLEKALGGGGAMSLRVDSYGKTMQSLMLDIDVPDGVGRQPA
jgi:hypothetical protein